MNTAGLVRCIAKEITFDVPVTNCSSLAISSLLKLLTTSQNHWTTLDAALQPVYSVLAFRSSTAKGTISFSYLQLLVQTRKSRSQLTINFRKPADQKLKLFIIKNGNKFPRDQFVEPIQEGIDLRTNSICEDVISNKFYMLMVCFFCNPYISSSSN